MTTKQDKERAASQAKAQADSIVEMVEALEKAQEDGEAELYGDMMDEDEIRQAIQEDALSVEVRSSWHSPGFEDSKPDKFNILLCTGGPAVRIIGDLSEHGEPDGTHIVQYQDWFTGWENYPTTTEQDEAIDAYCREFWFGE